MAIHAGWHIWIPLSDQGRAMDTVLIEVKDLRVAAVAGLRNAAARYRRIGDVVGTVAIGTHGCIFIPIRQCLMVGVICSDILLVLVALEASFIHFEGEVPPRLHINGGVRVSVYIGMALLAGVALRAVNGIHISLGVNGKVQDIAVSQGSLLSRFPMADKAFRYIARFTGRCRRGRLGKTFAHIKKESNQQYSRDAQDDQVLLFQTSTSMLSRGYIDCLRWLTRFGIEAHTQWGGTTILPAHHWVYIGYSTPFMNK